MTHVVFDLETDSPDPNTARIVSMAFVTLDGETILHSLVNPLVPIPPGATRIHGITDADVAGAKTFLDQADEVQAIVKGAILCGYNSRRFDVPVLDRELRNAGRAGIDLATAREIDAHQVWILMQPRTLSGAVSQWCPGEALGNAHDALADALATAKVVNSLALVLPLDQLETASVPPYEIDRAGKFKRCPETGRAIINIGKHRGDYAANQKGFLRWMLGADFPEETKSHIERWLAQ